LWCSNSWSSRLSSARESARSQTLSALRPADLVIAEPVLAGAIERAVGRQDQRSIVGELEIVGADIDALAAYRVDFAEQCPRIDDHSVADDRQLARPDHPRGKKAQFVLDIADHQRVAGIVAALKAHDDIGPLREPVDDLALAFIAPLRADHGDIAHLAAPYPSATGLPFSRMWLHRRRRAAARLSPAGSSMAIVTQPVPRSLRAAARSAPYGSNNRCGAAGCGKLRRIVSV
jgi:hypothetical protein